MTKIEVTDEMVRRLCKHAKLYGAGLVIIESFSRALLEAALAEPEEIPVSEGMRRAGNALVGKPSYHDEFVAAVYRAMEAERRKEEELLL